jgi:putative addiction module antidote
VLAFKVTTVGSSAGIILTKEVMARLRLQKGDTIFLTEAPDGSYRLTPYSPEFERQMKIAERVMHDDRNLLRALAK